MSFQNSLITKLKNRSATIGVIGLGYVGLPLVIRFVDEGFKVIGVDVDKNKIDILKRSQSYIGHIPNEKIINLINCGMQPTSDFSLVSNCDVIILCVPTPLNKYREPDLSFVVSTINSIQPFLRNGQVISLESTTYPGTTEEEIATRIEDAGFSLGDDIYLIYSPEREDPGNAEFDTISIPKVVGGYSTTCLKVGIALYSMIISTIVPVSSLRVAEMTKLLENIHRAVNIGLVNEMKIVADKMGIDIFEVIDAAATKPFGFTPYYPGPGLGGHCIPIDPFYLTWKAREYGLHTRFIELAGEINKSMPNYVVSKLIDGLNKQEKSLKGSKILILGIAYKKNVDDMRESPSVEIIQIISNKGAIVDYCDPHVPIFPKMRAHNFDLKSVELSRDVLKNYDAAILVTDHDVFDYDLITKCSSLLIDTRGIYKESRANIVKA